MNIEHLNQELIQETNYLESKLNICKRQNEVLSIIMGLKSSESSILGHNGIMNAMDITKEGMNDFIALLNGDEYIKGQKAGTSNCFGEHPRVHTYEIYYVTLGVGNIVELSFCETEIKGFCEPTKVTCLDMDSYASPQDLSIRIYNKTDTKSKIEFVTQGGYMVFDVNTTDGNVKWNNQMLNEVLTPISIEDLTERFLRMVENQREKFTELSGENNKRKVLK